MKQYRVSAAAKSDLSEIWSFIARDHPDVADKFIRNIISLFPKLAAMRELGRRRDELAPRLRSFPIGRCIIFYRPLEQERLEREREKTEEELFEQFRQWAHRMEVRDCLCANWLSPQERERKLMETFGRSPEEPETADHAPNPEKEPPDQAESN